MLLAIDPGPGESAYVLVDIDGDVMAFDTVTNGVLIDRLEALVERGADMAAVEMIASYGMPVGAEVFGTCVYIGRVAERLALLGVPVQFITRITVKSHLCHSAKAADKNVRRALIDMYGPGDAKAIGKKATPGPLYGVTGHVWQALGVAITALETSRRAVAA